MDILKEKPVADLRDYLAEERTFLAWIRTGIAFMGFGFVVARFEISGDEPHFTQQTLSGQPHEFSLWFGVVFPKGVALSMARRLELLAWARGSGAWIVEDDYASKFRYGGRPLASLQGLDEAERVIYIEPSIRRFFPGLRMGYAVVHPSLVRAFITARYLMDRQPSSLCQAVVAAFMEEGHFAAHIRRMREMYRNQRDALVAALRRRLGDHLTVDPPEACIWSLTREAGYQTSRSNGRGENTALSFVQ